VDRPRSSRTPFALRIARGARVAVHVFNGIAKTTFVFPRVGIDRRRALIRRWSRELLAMLHVEAFVVGVPVEELPGNLLIVANHVSWLDIFVLHSLRPSRFIGKSELMRWPLLRHIIIGSGTLFIERDRWRDALRINVHAREALAAGDTIAIFPEGTTSDGTGLLPFHASLVQPIIDAQGHLLPIAIRYRGTDGAYTDAPIFVGETSFVESLWRVLGERRFVAEIILGPALSARERHRRELLREAETFIRSAVEAPARDPTPGTRARRRLSSR
jgi:1-acyl-sn-glycerol-3-phosphate acyltransferase